MNLRLKIFGVKTQKECMGIWLKMRGVLYVTSDNSVMGYIICVLFVILHTHTRAKITETGL